MISRRLFFERGILGLLASFISPSLSFSSGKSDFGGLVVNDDEGEEYRLRDGRPIIKIKISKQQGSESMSFLASMLPPGDVIPVHKHLNEDEIFFIHQGSGIFTLGEKQYPISQGAVMIAPKGIWHGLQNTGNENIEMRFVYNPSGFEGFFKDVGTPLGQTFVEKTMDERKAIAKKWGMVFKD